MLPAVLGLWFRPGATLGMLVQPRSCRLSVQLVVGRRRQFSARANQPTLETAGGNTRHVGSALLMQSHCTARCWKKETVLRASQSADIVEGLELTLVAAQK